VFLLAGWLTAGIVPCHGAELALAVPAERVVLTVSGRISVANADGKAVFDRPMLERFAIREIRTSTPWTDGVQEFEGVFLSDVLTAVGAEGEMLVLTALDDYRVQVPVSDLWKYGVVVALKQDGAYMAVRDKGPLWVIYPMDDYAELRSHRMTDRMIWQLSAVEVR
jgi:hypothetical protein